MSLSSIPSSLRMAVRTRDEGRCAYCHLNQIGQSSSFHIDHIIPRSKDGLTVIENLVLQCPNSSLHKANKIEGIDPVTNATARLFHPLVDQWSEHFMLQSDGTVLGLSAVGRASVTALQMNAPMP